MAVALAQLALLGLPHQATNPTLTPHKGGVKAEISTTGRALEFIDGSNLTAIAKDQQKNGRHQFKKVEKTQHSWCRAKMRQQRHVLQRPWHRATAHLPRDQDRGG